MEIEWKLPNDNAPTGIQPCILRILILHRGEQKDPLTQEA
jgi:hypothetical protein